MGSLDLGYFRDDITCKLSKLYQTLYKRKPCRIVEKIEALNVQEKGTTWSVTESILCLKVK